MKVLVIAAQDIHFMDVAYVVDGVTQQSQRKEGDPDTYLEHLHQTLETWNLSLKSFEAIVVVAGPGSFTSSRVSTTIANAIAFTQGIPILGLENPKHLPLVDLLKTTDLKMLPPLDHFVQPVYDRPAHITQPRTTPWG